MSIKESQILNLIIHSTSKYKVGVTHLNTINNEEELSDWLVNISAKKEVINDKPVSADCMISSETMKSELMILDFKPLIKTTKKTYGYNDVIKETLCVFSVHFELIIYPISIDKQTKVVDYSAAYIAIDLVDKLEEQAFIKRIK